MCDSLPSFVKTEARKLGECLNMGKKKNPTIQTWKLSSFFSTFFYLELLHVEAIMEVDEANQVGIKIEPWDWWFLLVDYALHGILSEGPKETASIRNKEIRFYYNAMLWTLYQRSHGGILFHRLSKSEAQEGVKETHYGTCEAHQLGPKR